ncbi:MAG: helix-turn-helix domain-containing protein [Allorhizobium sp.]
MRTFDVSAAIERAKKLHDFKLDQQLAEYLEVSRTSLASWKRRNSIPAKHLLQMVFGTEHSVDWLVSGREKEALDEFGFTKEKLFVDPYVLWLALLMYRYDLESGSDNDKAIAVLLDNKALSYFHIWLSENITRLTFAKTRWEQSGLVKGKDVYKAIATEFGLGTYELPPTPWWEDDSII